MSDNREARLFDRLATVMAKRSAERAALRLFAKGEGTPEDARAVLAHPLSWTDQQYRKRRGLAPRRTS